MAHEPDCHAPPPVRAFSALELTGRARSHVVALQLPPCVLHVQTVEPFLAMRTAAAAAGIELLPVSSFRDFERQLAIWNGKFRGERLLNGRDGEPVQAAALKEAARIDAILAWSALPGASRHHWGTDIDVIDAARVPPGAPVSLTPAAYAPGGLFAHLDVWLTANMTAFGFHRPYVVDRGGVQPEPWHLSHASVARAALAAFSPQILREALADSEICGRELLLAQLPALFARFVMNVESAPQGALLSSATRFS